MKVLILGSGRCGTSRLAWCLSEHYKIPFTSEPFNWSHQKIGRQTDYIVKDNHLIKCLPCYQQYIDPELKELSHIEDAKFRTLWFMEFSLQFDKVILMDRIDTSERLLSALHAHKHGTWWDKYDFKSIELTEKDKPIIDDFLYTQKVIHDISKNLAIPITYMEDLYTTDKEKSKDTWLSITQDYEYKGDNFNEIYDKFFSPEHKQRT